MDVLFELIEPVQSFLFEQAVLPVLYQAGFMSYAEDAYLATGLFILGLVQIGGVYALVRPLEAWVPVERWRDRRAVRADILYTWLERTGLLSLAFFLLLQPLLNPLEQMLRAAGYLPPNLEELIPSAGAPLAVLALYIVMIDFFEYWRHRLQHRFAWWWALHSIHHSQRQMSLWTDDRNHLLDSLIEALWLALLAFVIGIPPALFVLALFLVGFAESLSHANVRFGFGTLGNRLIVSPHYHRLHHGIGVGHEGAAGGCNFATLFPVWDILFGTANFSPTYPATGIRDQLTGADYGERFWQQQVQGMRRFRRALKPGRPRAAGTI